MYIKIHVVVCNTFYRPSFCAPKYSIMDADRKEILNIQGPVCFCQGICCPGDIEFVVSIHRCFDYNIGVRQGESISPNTIHVLSE